MELHIFDNKDLLCDGLLDWITEKIQAVLKVDQKFTIALSGGATPKMLYEKLSLSTSIDWSKIHFFWGDERFVPIDDERNNAGMAFQQLINKITVPADQVHPMRTDIDIPRSVEEYDFILHKYFPKKQTFDLVLLGMGNDGHTLSLFPGSDLLNDNTSWVQSTVKKGENIGRITLMPSIVNNAHYVVFLVSGIEKAPMIKNIIELDPYYPANLIDPESKELHWFLDKEAASLL